MAEVAGSSAVSQGEEGVAEPLRGVLLWSPADFGSYMRACRTGAGLSQAELASRVGVSRKWISEVENGKATVELGRVVAAFSCLGLVLRAEPTPALDVAVEAHLEALFGDRAKES